MIFSLCMKAATVAITGVPANQRVSSALPLCHYGDEPLFKASDFYTKLTV